MKAMLAMPSAGPITKLFTRESPVLVPAATGAYLRPVEIRRYIRNLRAPRQYEITRDFIY